MKLKVSPSHENELLINKGFRDNVVDFTPFSPTQLYFQFHLLLLNGVFSFPLLYSH